jgi:type III restriction enzyme
MISLKEYQRNAVDQLKDCTQTLLKSSNSGEKLCIFQAPTGSGKTVMAAVYIEEMLRTSVGENLCFLWISAGKGELHIQSKRSLTNIFQEFPKVTLYDEEYHGAKDSLDNQSVTVVNWEKLRNKDNKTGNWKNTLMKDAEYFNFREVLPNTKAKGLKIIAIIDESHIGGGANRTTELREIINADVWIEVSATPKTYDNQRLKELREGDDSPIKINRGMYYIYVNADDVIQEGMIKKNVIVNEGMHNFDVNSEDSQTLVLHAAIDKRLMLKELYKKEGTKINPLVLIQIENADAGSNTMKYVQDYFAKKGVDKDNIAIWLSGEKSESIQYISDADNHIEFLIFKQAIDTGWDCPRAQILVKFSVCLNKSITKPKR